MKKNYLIGGIVAVLVIGGLSLHFLSEKNSSVQNKNLAAEADVSSDSQDSGTVSDDSNNSSSDDDTPADDSPSVGGGDSTGGTIAGAPSVSVTNPINAQVYAAGKQITVKWKNVSMPATDHTASIYLGAYGSKANTIVAYIQLASNISNTGQAIVTLPATLSGSGAAFGDNFKILVAVNNMQNPTISGLIRGTSGTFTISASAVKVVAGQHAWTPIKTVVGVTNVWVTMFGVGGSATGLSTKTASQ